MKAQYITQVKKHLNVPGKAKAEIIRDLEEIFSSAMEHGEKEAAVIERLGPPKEYAENAGSVFSDETVKESGVREVGRLLAAAVSFALAVLSFFLYHMTKPFTVPENVIGQADGVTTILLANPGVVDVSTAYLLLGLAAAAIFVIVVVHLLYHKRRRQ